MAIDETLLSQLQYAAVPVHTPRQHGRLSLDPRLARKFLRSTTLAPEERTMLVQYITTAKWQPRERAVYAAIVDKFTTISEISAVTGMSESEVDATINKLAKKGMVRRVKG